MSHYPRKRFGQNFLVDEMVIHRIIQAIEPKKEDQLLEIGPGLGALTFPILKKVAKLNAIELDRDIIAYLKEKAPAYGHLKLFEGDALKFNFEDLFAANSKIRCIGNLPYNISTPLIFHLLQQRQWIQDMHFMLQKEVVERLGAKPGSKTYGRLSIMVQYYCEVESLFVVNAQAFNPPPKVESAIVMLKPYKELPYKAENESLFVDIVRAAFNQRRKTITNSLKHYSISETLAQLGLNPKSRPEQLKIEEFVAIANHIEHEN